MQHVVYSYLDKPNCKAFRLFAMDFSKAFDCVNHEMLSNKLKRLPLDPHIINWYLSFLDNRQQRVVYNSFEGQWKKINRGTTQGSVSDPYIFNIFINALELVLGNQPALFKYADDSSIIVPIWSNGLCRTDLVDEFLTWTNNNKMVCNPVKCKELVFRKSNYNDNIAQIHNIQQCNELLLLGVTFQSNCKYNLHVKSKLLKANKCLFILRSLRKEGMCQEGVDRFFNTVVLPNFTYGLSVYGTSDSDLTAIQSFLDRSFKRKYISVKIDIRSILEESDLNLYKSRSISPCPIFCILPKEKETNYNLRKTSVKRQAVNTERLKNSYVNRLIFKYSI
ncbi:uncharacterized protein [Montipora capricornis]|uniref:uncharacterized protein n=1 Tax=Montipora capricornis TaxID=246305 RepID=UPI0035F15488